MSDLIYCGTDKVAARETQLLLRGTFGAIWSPPMLRRTVPLDGERLWLIWRETQTAPPLLLGVGNVRSTPDGDVVWTNASAPGVVEAARALGYDGPTNMAFLRLSDVVVFDSMPILNDLEDVEPGLQEAGHIHARTLVALSARLNAEVPSSGRRHDETILTDK